MLSPTALRVSGGLTAYLTPKMALDQHVPKMRAILHDVTRRNFGSKRSAIAARVRYATRGRLALDADLSDLMDLLDALEEGFESEPEEGGDQEMQADPTAQPPSPEQQMLQTGTDPGYDEEEERCRMGNSSESIEERIQANMDRKRQASDKRRATLDSMRQIIRNAMTADMDVPGYNENVGFNHQALEPTRTPADKHDYAADSARSARSRMLANMARISDNAGLAYNPTVGGSSPGSFGSAASSDLRRRIPGLAKIKL